MEGSDYQCACHSLLPGHLVDGWTGRVHCILIYVILMQLVESEIVAKNCQVRCNEQNIPYYRFSPHLNQVISAGETDNEKLLDMMLQTRIQTPQQGLSEIPSLFHLIASASKKDKYRQSRLLAEQDSD